MLSQSDITPVRILKTHKYPDSHPYRGKIGVEWSYDVQNPDAADLALIIPIKEGSNWMLYIPEPYPEYYAISVPNGWNNFGHALTYDGLIGARRKWIQEHDPEWWDKHGKPSASRNQRKL